jgi:hypothetical protein
MILREIAEFAMNPYICYVNRRFPNPFMMEVIKG